MGKAHLKRLNAPKTWKVKRKGIKFITKPSPGPHSKRMCMPLNIVLRDKLGYASTTKEIKHILLNKEILIDGKRRQELKYPLGFMDVLDIPELKEYYRMLLDNKGYLILLKIDKKEANLKPCKIMNKTILKGGRTQLNLSHGINKLVDKDSFKTGDTLVLEMPKQDVKEHIKLEKGAYVFMTGGTHVGTHGVVEEVKLHTIFFKSSSGKSYETLKRYALVIGKDKPMISLLK